MLFNQGPAEEVADIFLYFILLYTQALVQFICENAVRWRDRKRSKTRLLWLSEITFFPKSSLWESPLQPADWKVSWSVVLNTIQKS